MLLLGAGASFPLGIPTMEGFVRQFEDEILTKLGKEEKELYGLIEAAINNSSEYVDYKLAFDL
ncbi:MAG: hypothetical protein ACXQT1_01535, partial [Methermicoccaceae archaeon]